MNTITIKAPSKGWGIGPFLNQVKTRNRMIEAAPDDMPQSISM